MESVKSMKTVRAKLTTKSQICTLPAQRLLLCWYNWFISTRRLVHQQQHHLRPARRSGEKKNLPCLYGAWALQWHCWCCVCRVLVFPQWTEADVSRDTCSGSASSSAAGPACQGSSLCPKIHPSLSPLACYCLKHCCRFLNSLRHFGTFLLRCLIIICWEWMEQSKGDVIIGAEISLWSLWWKDPN